MKNHKGFAPREVFEQILEWAVIPTFDLVIEYGNQGIILVRRIIPPYNNQWALPGLRMYKGESIDDTIRRIAKQEVGLTVEPTKKILLGQYTAKFRTEHNRQDLSTGYLLKVSDNQPIVLNQEHFSQHIVTKKFPRDMGAIYKFCLQQYRKMKKDG